METIGAGRHCSIEPIANVTAGLLMLQSLNNWIPYIA